MIAMREFDLADHDPDQGIPTDDVWVLIRDGSHVLGEYRFSATADTAVVDKPMRHFVEDRFAAELALSDQRRRAQRPPIEVRSDELTIVVCTRERPEYLVDCIAALQTLDPAPGQILVVDNAPLTDSTRRIAQEAGVDYVVEPALGLNHARNAGWRTATGVVVAYVDDDARADRHFAAAITSAYFDETIGAVTGLVLAHELRTRAQIAFEIDGGMRKGFERRIFEPGSVGLQAYRLGVGTNMSFRRTSLKRVGGFDPEVGVGTPTRGGGDLEGLWRVLQNGDDIVYEPDAIVRHIHRATWPELIAQHRDFGVTYASFLDRCARSESKWTVRRELVGWHLRRHLLGPIRAVRARNRTRARLLLAELEGSLSWHFRR